MVFPCDTIAVCGLNEEIIRSDDKDETKVKVIEQAYLFLLLLEYKEILIKNPRTVS